MIKQPNRTSEALTHALARAILKAGAAASKDERDSAMALADSLAANLSAAQVESAHRYCQGLAENETDQARKEKRGDPGCLG